jgi:hypothetical protein
VRDDWEGDNAGGAVPLLALDSDIPSEFLEKAACDSQAESGSLALAFGGKERVENLRQMLLGNTGA